MLPLSPLFSVLVTKLYLVTGMHSKLNFVLVVMPGFATVVTLVKYNFGDRCFPKCKRPSQNAAII